MTKWLIAVFVVLLLAVGGLFYWGATVRTPEMKTACFTAGGDRLLQSRDGYSCWREDGTRVWFQ